MVGTGKSEFVIFFDNGDWNDKLLQHQAWRSCVLSILAAFALRGNSML